MDDDLQAEHDFRALPGAVHGRYAARVRDRPRVVRLADDVAGAFADEAEVNDALRTSLRLHRPEPSAHGPA